MNKKSAFIKKKSWERQYQELVEFEKKYGHTRVPQSSMKSLNAWCYNLRRKKDRLTLEQKNKLKQVGFDFSDGYNQKWNARYEELLAFKREYGHTLVPRWSMMPLYSWCREQRRSSESLTPLRRRKLDAIGFSWPGARIETWENKFQKLTAFKKKHGHTNVPSSETNLYEWCNKQREDRKGLSTDRKKRLNQLGFAWRKLKIRNDSP